MRKRKYKSESLFQTTNFQNIHPELYAGEFKSLSLHHFILQKCSTIARLIVSIRRYESWHTRNTRTTNFPPRLESTNHKCNGFKARAYFFEKWEITHNRVHVFKDSRTEYGRMENTRHPPKGLGTMLKTTFKKNSAYQLLDRMEIFPVHLHTLFEEVTILKPQNPLTSIRNLISFLLMDASEIPHF